MLKGFREGHTTKKVATFWAWPRDPGRISRSLLALLGLRVVIGMMSVKE